jgi:hypothetical protein
MNEPVNPAFFTEFDKYKRIVEKHGKDSEQALNQFMKVFELSPEYIKQEAHAKAIELDLIPKPSAYTDDGQPLYSATDIAAKLGIDENEMIARLDELGVYQGNINRIQ